MSQYNVIGKNVPRVDAAAKVNGTAIYCDDVYFRNTVYGKLVHSPFAHAKILSIDISAALALPGVVTVLLAKDIPDNRTIGEEHGWLLAEKEVCYIGDPVALVAADSERIAEEAAKLIKVEYEELPGVFYLEDALKEATNKNMKVINLLDVLKDTVKTEEAMPGMQAEEGHHHGYSHFADSDVQDRSLSDWDGEWQSVYPYLQEGILDEVMERKAENGNKTAEEYRAYYETGYKTDVSKITINAENNTMCFVKNGVEATAAYQYKGYQIYDYESGSRGVRYFFEATDGDADAPKYVQFSDHGIAPGKAEHFHIYFGNEGFDALSQEMENWPTYYPMDMSGDEIKEDMLEHAEKEYDEHVWLSLKNAETLCNAITDALEEIDPANKDAYATNAASYLEKLAALDGEYQTVVDNAARKTVLFGDRFPFRYLVDDYGLSYYAAFAGCSAETEASFETISFLAGKVDELRLPCVLTIEGAQHKIAETIVQNTAEKNQSILTLDSMQSTTSTDVANGTTYLSVMESNLDVLKQALN